MQADIEGFEFDLFNELLRTDGVDLPEQISFELHYETQFPELRWAPRQKTAGEVALLATQLYLAGYRLLSREDNRFCDHCTEFTVARFRCPREPRSMVARVAAQTGQRAAAATTSSS